MSSQARQLCYPRSNFLVISSPHQGGLRGSLGLHFCSELHLINNPVRLTFALALYDGFLTHLSQPLGPVDIFSTGCHPSQTVHLLLSSFQSQQHIFRRVVFHWRLHLTWRPSFNNYHLHYTSKPTLQQQNTVKFHGVFASHWKSLAFAPVWNIRRILVGDSGDLVTPFMQVVNQTTRYYAHNCYIQS